MDLKGYKCTCIQFRLTIDKIEVLSSQINLTASHNIISFSKIYTVKSTTCLEIQFSF